MCVKFSLRDLNPGPYPSHSTSTYICREITTPKVSDGKIAYGMTPVTVRHCVLPCSSHIRLVANIISCEFIKNFGVLKLALHLNAMAVVLDSHDI